MKKSAVKNVTMALSSKKGQDRDLIENVKNTMRGLKDLLFEMDQMLRVQEYRLAVVSACHDDGSCDLSYEGIAEYNVPARLLRRPGSGPEGLRKNKALYKKGDTVEGPIGWGSTLDVQLPESIKRLHGTKNMAAFNLAEPSKTLALMTPQLCPIHPLAIKNYKEMHTDEEVEKVEPAAEMATDYMGHDALAQLNEAKERVEELESRLHQSEKENERIRLLESEIRLDEARKLFAAEREGKRDEDPPARE